MNQGWMSCLIAPLALSTASACCSTEQASNTPQAGTRTYAQNYKDMVLGICIGNAYKNNEKLVVDTGYSINALRDWAFYDLEKAPDEIRALVDSYLARDYRNPLVESGAESVRFDFLKCLDLYHSEDLNRQVTKLVIHPGRTYRQDNSQP